MRFKGLLQKSGWMDNVEVSLDSDGTIISIAGTEEPCSDFALPGFCNSHSHAFQYAMAGTAENHTNPNDDFWSWRDAMYRLALAVSPDHVEAIAAMAYSEMLRHGYTHVAEFHYLHHDKNGERFGNLAEIGERLIAAAVRTGINLTLVPVFYKTGGFGKPAADEQRRFVCRDIDEYFSLVEASARATNDYPNTNWGFGIHSLRAVPAADVIRTFHHFRPGRIPVHIHIAEQLREVEECVAFCGKRPVEWLLANTAVDQRTNLVHATHLLEHELDGIVASGANVVICPTTEGNLGDGIFPFKDFRERGGSWSIGTDSHVSLNPFEEIRLLDYGQRLVSQSRNTFGETGSLYAITAAFEAGQRAMGLDPSEFFEVGTRMNACVISSDHPLIALSSAENRLNTIVYSSDETMQKGSIVNGVRSGLAEQYEEIRNEFAALLKILRNR